VRETLAVAGASLVHGTVVPIEKDATALAAPQNDLASLVERSVIREESLLRNPQEARQLRDVAFGKRHFGNAAAFGALAAVDDSLHFFGSVAELALDKSVRLNPLAKAEIVRTIFFALPPDLNQVCNHLFRVQSKSVSDRLYLSCWLRGFSESSMLRHCETLLTLFPFSKLAARGPVLRVYAIEMAEPPLLEREFAPGELSLGAAMINEAREFVEADCCLEVEASWDLWQWNGEWKLAPAAVTILCFGPGFDRDADDHMRIEFGPDFRFLPIEGMEGSLRMSRSNLLSLLHLVGDIERALPIERRRIWSESGANFAELLAETVARLEVN
jgi:hypothetical protein